MMRKIECENDATCLQYDSTNCDTCAHNKKRNYPVNKYKEAKDQSLMNAKKVNGHYVLRYFSTRDGGEYMCPACRRTYYSVGAESYCEGCGLPVTTKER